MLSIEDMSAVEVAIEICNNPELKREILCASDNINKGNHQYSNKEQWNEIVEKKTAVILENLGLEKRLQEKVIGIVLSVGLRMLTWVYYHEGILGFSREYSVNFLNSSYFTQQGIIDNEKAAEELMKDESLNIKQKYKLACLYCFTDHIPALYRQMTKEDKEKFYDAERPQRIKQPELVKFWSYYLMGEIDKLKGEKKLDQYRLEKAVESGSKAAVEYCLEKTNLRRKKDVIVDAAVEAVECRVRAGPSTTKDWVVFENQRYIDSEESWVPSDYYVDILSFLLSKMRENQQIEFLKKDIKGAKYKREYFRDQKHSTVLEYFLNWPYQDYFMEKAKLMWEFLPERDYAVLLLRICDKIEPRKEENLKYSENRSYNYRELLKKFWCQSPERYKRYVFSNQKVNYITERKVTTKAGVGLLINLFTLQNFTHEDRENIKLILASATGKEIENILSSEEWRKICVGLMKEEKWEILDRFVVNCFLSKEEEDKFKRELSFTNEAQRVCIDFVKNDKWNAAELFIKWSSLPEEEINQLKKEMIYSEEGRGACVDLISPDKKVKAVDKFIRWCFSSEEEVKAFKKELVFIYGGIWKCESFVTRDQLELVSEFINFCLSSEEEVRELKKNVAYSCGSLVCEILISDSVEENIYDNEWDVIGRRINFKGGKWEEVEKFLTWCFSSEDEINNFKKNKLLKLGTKIHFKLIESNQWEEAETFFTWLGLSAEEIKKLKKETLFRYDAASEMFSELMYSEEGDERFVKYGSKQEAIELLLRWYLTDEETVLEFKSEFKGWYSGEITEKDKAVFENFDLAIAQRLKDLKDRQLQQESDTKLAKALEEKEQQLRQVFDDKTQELNSAFTEKEKQLQQEFDAKLTKALEEKEQQLRQTFDDKTQELNNAFTENEEKIEVKGKSETFSPNKVLCQDINEEEKEQQSWQAFDVNSISSTSDSQSIVESVQTVTVNDMLFGAINDSTLCLKSRKGEMSTDAGDELETAKFLKTLSKEERENFGFFSQNKKLCLNDLNGEQRGVKRGAETFSPSKKLCN